MTIRDVVECAGSCRRMLRPNGELEDKWPGTVAYYARAMCQRCHRTTERPKLPPIRDCERCGHSTRPKTMKYADAPGTKVRNGQLCDPCSNAGTHVTPERARYVAGELVAYLRSRGRQLEPKLLEEAS